GHRVGQHRGPAPGVAGAQSGGRRGRDPREPALRRTARERAGADAGALPASGARAPVRLRRGVRAPLRRPPRQGVLRIHASGARLRALGPEGDVMKVLVIGSGGREHALAWKLAQSRRVSEVIVAPGNAGTAAEPQCRNAPVKADDLDGLLELAEAEDVALTVVGPEVPLVAGVVDRFRAAGRRIFGPTAAAARLEGSKAFAKDFLKRHGIPTALYAVHTDVDAALAYIRDKGAPIVVK